MAVNQEKHVKRVLSIRGLSKSFAEDLVGVHNLNVVIERHEERGKLVAEGPFSDVNFLVMEANLTCFGR